MVSPDLTPKLFSLLRQGYNLKTFRSDLMAGLTVAIIALPLSMAFGIASGASPDKGLVTAVIAGFLISFLGGSRVQIGGPTGAFIVVIFNVITEFGYDGLLLATMLAGIILIIAGYARFGRVVKYIPYPVVTGFTAGIAVIIASSQIKDFIGLDIPALPAEFIAKWQSYFSHLDSFNLTTFAVGLCALLTIILLKLYAPKWPGYLLAIVLTALGVFVFQLPVATVGSRFPDLPSGLPMPHLTTWDFEKMIAVAPAAITIAFLAGVESLLSAVVADGMMGSRHRPDQELVGQGVANIASALFGGMPATGAIARTATNLKSGGKTPIAGMSHAIFILLFILFAGDAMAFVPLAALSAILFVVAWNMSEYQHFVHIFWLSKGDRIVMLLTFGLTVLIDLTVAIGVGVTLASLLFMREMSRAVTLRSQGRNIRDTDQEEELDQRDILPEGVEVFRITGPLFFGVAGTVLDTLQAMGSVPGILIIRMKHVPYMDVAGLNALKKLIKECQVKKTIIIFSGLQQQPAEMFDKAGIGNNQTDIWLLPAYDDAIVLVHRLMGQETNELEHAR